MKTSQFLTLLLFIALFQLTSCTKEEDTKDPKDDTTVVTDDDKKPLINKTIKNLFAYNTVKNGEEEIPLFTKFNFKTGEETQSGTDWDIAFSSTTIIVNGGVAENDNEPIRNGNAAAYIAEGILDAVKTIDANKFRQDSKDSYAILKGGNGWYQYDSVKHVISAIPGRVLVFKTHDGKYAKVEILSYYKDFKDDGGFETARYYTFNYTYQPNENTPKF